MTEKYYKVTLLSDIVLNSKLSTDGNMETLNYIPGSNFLGIVAAPLYRELQPEKAYDIFHSGKVSFGDATISQGDELSYPVPFDYMMVKGEEKLGKDKRLFLQHLLTEDNHPKENDYKLQLKQKRSGFITPSGKAITKIKKNFALKSAQDAKNRRSQDGAMFGFESIKKGQVFIFSVRFKDEQYIDKVEKTLLGKKRVGKSKSAQYGQVEIKSIDNPQKIATFSPEENFTLVYAQSNLCFYDEFGQPTFQPKAQDLGFKDGEINWKKSQIRTYEYSPWNGKRNTTDTLRACIAAGSVFYVKGKQEGGFKQVGAHRAEGLGRVIMNPEFLKGTKNDAKCAFSLKASKDDENKSPRLSPQEILSLKMETPLGSHLHKQFTNYQDDIKLSQAIQEELNGASKSLKEISNSQWGAIRNYATKAKDWDELKKWLFEREKDENNPEKTVGVGYLEHGVAFKRYWKSNKEEFQSIFNKGEKYGPVFIVKFAAEMAKK